MPNCGVVKFERSLWDKLLISDISKVHERLHLPENYQVLSIEARSDMVDVIVSSDDIPDRGEDEIPIVKPVLSYNTETKKVSLDHIEIYKGGKLHAHID